MPDLLSRIAFDLGDTKGLLTTAILEAEHQALIEEEEQK
jgi:hypothetical protein